MYYYAKPFSFLPILVAIALSSIFHTFTETLQLYHKYLRLKLRNDKQQSTTCILQEFFEVHKLVSKLYKVLDFPTFFLILQSFNNIFISLPIAMKEKNYEFLTEIICFLFSGLVLLLTYVFFSSKITKKLFEIKKTTRANITAYLPNKNFLIQRTVIIYLKKIEK